MGTIANLPGTEQRLWVTPGGTPTPYYTVPQSIELHNNQPQYQVRTSSSGTSSTADVMASNPIMLYGPYGTGADANNEWFVGIIEIEAISGQDRQFLFGIQNVIEVEFFGTRWGTGPPTVMQLEKIVLRSAMLKPGNISGEALGDNSVGRQDEPGGLPAETKEEDGDFHCSDECDSFGAEAFKVWRQKALSRLRKAQRKSPIGALRKRHLPEALGETHRVAGRKYPRRSSGELCEVHQSQGGRLDSLGRFCTDYDIAAVKRREHPEEDGADSGDDTLRCEENLLNCTVSYNGSSDWEIDGVETTEDARDGLPLHIRSDGTWESYGSTADPEHSPESVSKAVLLQQKWGLD